MGEILIIKIVFGCLLSIGAFVLFLLAFLLFYKYIVQEKRCTAKTKGIVKKYTFASRGGDNGKVNLPVVYYNVDGKEYKVIGPEYKAFKILTKKSLTGENTIECKEENQVLIITRTTNSFINVYKNPIDELYPIGTSIDVYYDPKKPKVAYVLRYCNRKWAFYLMFFCGLGMLIIDLLILILL